MTPSTLLRLVLAALLLGASSAHAQTRAPGPELATSAKALRAALDCPRKAGEGEAVLLVHGTTSSPEIAWSKGLEPLLEKRGHVVCTVRLPAKALAPIDTSAEYVVASIRAMSTRFDRPVDVIGHSQGGMVPRWAVKWWPDVRSLVGDVIGLSPSNHGAPVVTALCGSNGCAAAGWQQGPSSRFLAALNRPDETPGRVSYTVAASDTDAIVPARSAAIRGGGDDSTVTVQEVCPDRAVDHVRMLTDAVSVGLVLDALSHRGPARARRVSSGVCDREHATGIDAAAAEQKEREGAEFSVAAFRGSKRLSAEPALPAYATRRAPRPRATLQVRRKRIGETVRLRFRALGAAGQERWPLPYARISAGGRRATTDERGRAVLRLKLPDGRLRVRLIAPGLEPLTRRLAR